MSSNFIHFAHHRKRGLPVFFKPSSVLLAQLIFVAGILFAPAQQQQQQQQVPSATTPLDEKCPSNTCLHGGVCYFRRNPEDGTKDYECECKDGFAGDLCEHKCTLRCLNGGKCRRNSTTALSGNNNNKHGDVDGAAWCDCPPGFRGSSPDCSEPERAKEVDKEGEEAAEEEDCRLTGCPFAHACLADPGHGGGAFRCEWDLCVRWGPPCSNDAVCKPVKNDFLCDCPSGYRGRQCAEDIDECAEQPQLCQNGGTCENTLGSFRCKCRPSFTGTNCQIELQRPCQQPFVPTRNETDGTTDCACPPGKAGHQCELTATNCDSEMEAEKCQHGGDCVQLGQRAFCICPTGFSGTHCETVETAEDEEEEPPEPNQSECLVKGRGCLNGGRCVRPAGKAQCKCKGQYTGIWCDRPLRLTAGKPTATTTKTIPTTTATTTSELNESYEINCEQNPCKNGGNCLQTENGSAKCHCPAYRSAGKFCQLQCRCPRWQECRESADRPGQVECFRPTEEESSLRESNNNNNNRTTNAQNEEEEAKGKEETEAKEKATEEAEGTEVGQTAETKATTPTNAGEPSTEKTSTEKTPSDRQVLRNFDIFAPRSATALDRPISNCSGCLNGAKCLTGEGGGKKRMSMRCLCTADFMGTRCDMKNPLCASLDCTPKPGQRCLFHRWSSSSSSTTREDRARCGCAPGLAGPRCTRSTTLGFSNASIVLLQQQQKQQKKPKVGKEKRKWSAEWQNESTAAADAEDYELALTFRTTLGGDVHLASGQRIMGTEEFSLWLKDGQIVLKTAGTAKGNQSLQQQQQQQQHTFDEPILRLNDADWYQVGIWSSRADGTGFELRHSDTGFLLARRTLTESQLFTSVWSTRLGQHGADAHFVGCMRDVVLNGAEEPVNAEDERAFNVLPGCDRREQCPTGGGGGVCLNGGRCIDRWDSFVCECPRSFLPPKCERQIREVTFGHGDVPSNIVFNLSADDQALVAKQTKISFLLRTNQHQNAVVPLFYLGSQQQQHQLAASGNNAADQQEMITFVAAELHKGALKVNVRLGGRMPFSVKSSVTLDDNRVHLVEIERQGNDVVLKVDGHAEPALHATRPFAHPLLAEQLIVGNQPPPGIANGNGSSFFKGTIQDFRVNDRFVLLFDDSKQPGENGEEADAQQLTQFGRKLSDQNLLQGTVSEDACSLNTGEDGQSPCGPSGHCLNTFNDFECKCEHGWMGPRCKQRDFCGAGLFTTAGEPIPLCPNGTECVNVDGAFVCTSTATLTTTSMLRYVLNQANVLKGSAKHTNLTVEFRTQTRTGNVLRLQSSTDWLAVELWQGYLVMGTGGSYGSSNATSANNNDNNSNISSPTAVSHTQHLVADGQWHKLVLRQQQHGLEVIVDDDKESLDNESLDNNRVNTTFSLKRFALDPRARVSIGLLPDRPGFKGCIRNLRIGTLPPLAFIGSTDSAQMADALAASAPHFALQRRENVRSIGGCVSTDVCAQNPCLNGARCEDLFEAMRCQCPSGFEGEHCQLPKDECELMHGHAECGEHGRCVDELNGFRCQCTPGFSGPKCLQERDLCREEDSSCKNGGKCRSQNGTAVCECPPQFIGHWCQLERGVKCSEQPCQNGGHCFQLEHGEIGCSCRPGFYGPLCELRVDPCQEMPCANGGKCVNTGNTSNPVDFHCECPVQFGGTLCERLADQCARMGNGSSCSGHGRCENVWGGHRCLCSDGWRGRHCSIQVDTCLEQMPCQNGGTCLPDSQKPGGFHCECPAFHMGDLCEVAGICAENPCHNGGECAQTSSVADFTCRCLRGFQGPTCEQRVDFCEQEPCQNGATCQPMGSDFACQCIPGFTGKKCELDVDECALPRTDGPACLHGGRCQDRVNVYECNCKGTGYKGPRCEVDIDECAEKGLNCQNGVCQNLPGSYRCECQSGYIGQHCHIADPCTPNPITNRSVHNCVHGRCVRPRVVAGAGGREFATHDCECQLGFTGELCMQLVEAQHAMTLSNFIGLGIVVLILCLSLGALLYLFVSCTRHKRANQGTYSPSTQEMTGQARFAGTIGSGIPRPSLQHPLPSIHHPKKSHHHHQHKMRRKN